jgi:HNH endonuclease
MSKCKMPMCTHEVRAKGLCSTHYTRFRLYGDPTIVKEHHFCGLTVLERFQKYVKKTDTCWIWTGAKNENGYGILNVKGRGTIASRLAWELEYGGIPEGKYVLHHCDNPSCVNPDHLYLGSQTDNMRDMELRSRANRVVGENNGKSKVTAAIVRAIRQSPEKSGVLAKQYGIHTRTVWQIRSGRTWRHID